MADGVAIRTLRVSAELDSASYAQGAARKVAADRAMVESGKAAAEQQDVTARKLAEGSRAVDALQRSIDPAFNAQQRLAAGTATVQRALDAGRISAERAAIVMEGLNGKYSAHIAGAGAAAAANQNLGNAFRFSFTEAEIFRSGLINTVQSLAAGLGPAKTFETQIFQIAPAFARVGAAALGIAAPIVAVGAVLALVISRASSIDSEIRALTVSLKAMGDVAGYSGGQLRSIATGLVQQGASRSDATAAVQAIVQQRSLQGPVVGQLAGLSVDVAAGLGTSVPEAAKKLADAAASGYAGFKKLDDELGIFNTTELANIRSMTEHGDRAGALALTIDKLHDRFDGLHREALSPAQQGFEDLRKSYDKFIEDVANSEPIQRLVKNLGIIAQYGSQAINPSTQSQVSQAEQDLDRARYELERNKTGRLGAPTIGQRQFLAEAQAGFDAAQERLNRLNAAAQASDFQGPDALYPTPAKAGGAASENVAATQDKKLLGELTEAYQREAKAAQASIGTRDIVRAGLAAEVEAREKLKTEEGAAALVTLRQNEARQKLATTAHDAIVIDLDEAKSQRAIAAAYGQSAAAGQQAEIVERARLEAVRNSAVIEKDRAAALRATVAAQSLAENAKQLDALKFQADASGALAAAELKGAAAVAEAARQTDVALFAKNALAKADESTLAAVNEQIAAYDKLTRTLLTNSQAAAANRALKSSQDDLVLAQAEFNLVGQLPVFRASELAVMQAKIQLQNQGISLTSAEGQAILANVEATTKLRAAAQEVDAITSKIGDAFAQSLIDGSKNAFDQLKSLAKTTLAQIASQMVFRPLIQPVVAQIVGAVTGVSGSTGGVSSLIPVAGAPFSSTVQGPSAPGELGFNQLSQVSSLFNAGKTGFNLFSGGSGISTSISGLFTQPLGASFVGPPTAAQAAAANLSFLAPVGSSGGLLGSGGALGSGLSAFGAASVFAALITIGKQVEANNENNAVGKTLLSLLGPSIQQVQADPKQAIGPLIGVPQPLLNALGLFNAHPTVGPNATARVATTPTGAFAYGASADNGGDAAGALALARSLADSVNAFVAALGGKITGGGLDFGVGSFPSQGGQFFENKNQFTYFGGDTEALANFASLKLLRDSTITGLGTNTALALKNSPAKTLQDLAGDIAIGQLVDNLGALKDNFDDLKSATDQAAAGVKAIEKQYDDFVAKATSLGIAAADVQKGFAASIDAQVQQQLDAIENPTKQALAVEQAVADARLELARKVGADIVKVEQLNAVERQSIVDQQFGDLKQLVDDLRFGDLSPLKGSDKLAAASTRYNQAVNDNAPDLAAIARQYLGVAKGALGTTQAFGAIYADVLNTAGSLAGLPGFPAAGASDNSDLISALLRSTSDQTATLTSGTDQTNALLTALLKEIRKLSDPTVRLAA
jgi:hypothetical protein